MPCWDARQHVSDYLDGDLAPELARLIESHLEVCPTCPPLYTALVGVQSELGRLRDPDSVIDPDLVARIQRRLAVWRRNPAVTPSPSCG